MDGLQPSESYREWFSLALGHNADVQFLLLSPCNVAFYINVYSWMVIVDRQNLEDHLAVNFLCRFIILSLIVHDFM